MNFRTASFWQRYDTWLSVRALVGHPSSSRVLYREPGGRRSAIARKRAFERAAWEVASVPGGLFSPDIGRHFGESPGAVCGVEWWGPYIGVGSMESMHRTSAGAPEGAWDVRYVPETFT